jgi:hypothetical protein
MVFHKILLGWAMLRTTVEDLNSGSMVLVGLRYLQQHFQKNSTMRTHLTNMNVSHSLRKFGGTKPCICEGMDGRIGFMIATM